MEKNCLHSLLSFYSFYSNHQTIFFGSHDRCDTMLAVKQKQMIGHFEFNMGLPVVVSVRSPLWWRPFEHLLSYGLPERVKDSEGEWDVVRFVLATTATRLLIRLTAVTGATNRFRWTDLSWSLARTTFAPSNGEFYFIAATIVKVKLGKFRNIPSKTISKL